jgi:hypothetical protein
MTFVEQGARQLQQLLLSAVVVVACGLKVGELLGRIALAIGLDHGV